MVKIGALIGAFFVSIGAFVQIIFYTVIASRNVTLVVFRDAMGMSYKDANVLLDSSIFTFSLGLVLVIGSEFIKGKLFLKIGGGIMILGILNLMLANLTRDPDDLFFLIGLFLMVLGVILYFVGCIHFRKHNIVAVITGFLLMIAVLCAQFIALIFFFSGEDPDLLWFRIHFITLSVQAFFFTLHSWVLGFSKKRVDYSDKVEDTLSVKNGQAFSSYIPDDMKKKKKKGKKTSESDEISFTF